MNINRNIILPWIKVGAICGITTSIIYPLLIFVEMPIFITAMLAAAMGLLLSVASIGLYQILKLKRKTITVQIATLFNIIAGTVLNLMLMVQLTLREYTDSYLKEATNEYAKETITMIMKGVDKVQLGLDLSWDVYLSAGTFFFAVNMLTHPRFGRIFGWLGISFAILLFTFNFYSFPVPPAEAGLIDFGPAIGLWYLAVSIQTLLSVKWVKNKLDQNEQPGA